MSDAHPFAAPTREQLAELIQRPAGAKLKRASLVLAVLGMVVFLIGVFTGQPRAWQAWHVNWLFFAAISSAGVVLAAVQRITTARWSRPVVRLVEGFAAFMPVAFVMLLLTVFFGKGSIFPWVHELPPQPAKQVWLNGTFWTLRSVVIFGLLTWLSVWFVYASVRLDVGVLPEWGADWARGIRARMRAGFGEERRELHNTHSLTGKLAVWLTLLFGLGWVVLSWDLSMSVDAQFQSTMYGWIFFIGAWLEAIMVLSLLARYWRRALGADEIIVDSHLHDIGKLAFAFTAFWGYISFGQLLVIWYGNVGEETHFFHKLLVAPWTPFTVAVGLTMFVIPFFGLLGKAPKIFTPTMATFAMLSIAGNWFHRYLEIYPTLYLQTRPTAPIGIWEIGITLGYLGIWGYCYFSFMDAFPRMRVFMMTSPYRDEVQIPVNPKTMEPLPAHE